MTPFTYEYPRPAVTVDVAVFAHRAGELHVLLIERKHEPFMGAWALPGGFVDANEALVDAALRELREETGLSLTRAALTQVGAFGDPGRDPRGHTVSVAYVTEVDAATAAVQAGDDAARAEWHAWSTLRLRPVSVARHVYDTGVTAVPIVSLIAFLISVILAYMGAQQLRKFGADIFVVDLVTVGVLRELGVLLTAIIVAGRSGSAFAAEIGAMQLNEEVDALHAIGVDPIEVLVLPRLFGLVIALPLLTLVADLIGLVGGGLLCHALLDMPLVQYLHRAQGAIASTTFWVGIVKAPVFACLIAISGCYCGMRVRGSSRDLGRLTTLAVVQSIFFVILVDALFAVLFMEMDV